MHALRSKTVIAISAALALVAALGAAAFWPAHAYRVRSGYSGHHFWLAFRTYPTEKQLYEAVLRREPSLSLGNDRLDEVQAAKRSFVPGFPAGDLVMAPYEAGHSPDTIFPGGRVKGVWLTEPSSRIEFSPAVVRAVYFVSVLVFVFIATWLILFVLGWGWYFFLGRVTEVSSAMRRPTQ